MPETSVLWRTAPDAGSIAELAADEVLAAATCAIARRGRFVIALAGGTTPERLYRLLASRDLDWSPWRLLYGDERCLPANDGERNSELVRRTWVVPAGIPDACHFPIPAELGPKSAASAYAAHIAGLLPLDFALLGLGEDGHTASLFPGHSWPAGETVTAVYHAPKPPPERVSLTPTALNGAARVCFLVAGPGKTDALRRWRAGEDLPAARIRGRERTCIFIDQAAAGGAADSFKG